MSGDDDRANQPGCDERFAQSVEQRAARHLEQTFRYGVRQRTEPGSTTGGEHNGDQDDQCKIESPHFPHGIPGGVLTRRVAVFLASLLTIATPLTARAQSPTGSIEGSVSTPKPTVRLAGALVVVTDRRGMEAAATASDGEGKFKIADLPEGQYRIAVSLEGFQAAETPVVVAAGKITALDFELPISVVAEKVEVVATALPGGQESLGAAESISSKENDEYSSGGGFQAALRLLASVIQAPGGLSIKGGRPTQASTQLGVGTLMDPSTGLVPLTLPPDAIDSVEVLANPYTVEFGRFSSGLVVLRTKSGGDRWKLRVNNFDPGFRTKRGQDFKIVGLKVFAPRMELGG